MTTTRFSNITWMLLSGVSAGAIAGTLVGFLETLYLCVSSGDVRSLSALWFSMIAYCIIGIGLALLWTLIRLPRKLSLGATWADAFAVALPFLAFLVIMFRIKRDLLKETVAWDEPTGWVLMIGTLIGILVVFWLLRTLLKRLIKGHHTGAIVFSWVLVIFFAIAGKLLGTLSPQGPGKVNWPKAAWAGKEAPPPNILLIIVDTLRDDFLTTGFQWKVDTPNIDVLSASGVRFANCWSEASKTRPSVASILTSLYPSSHGAEKKIDGLAPNIPHFPGILGQHGYATVALNNNINLTPFFGFDRGYDVYRYLEPSYYLGANDAASNLVVYGTLRQLVEKATAGSFWVRHYYWEGESVANLATQWLKSSPPEPFFFYVYFMDPHDPYFEHPYNGKATARVVNPNPPASELPIMRERYRSEIHYMDAQVGKVLKALDESGKADNTIVVFTADHGEEFQDHGGWWHGNTLYRELLHVPLIIRLPQNRLASTIRTDPVMSIDIGPTLMDLVGIAYPNTWEGIPLFSQIADSARIRFSEVEQEGNIVKAVNQAPWVWIEANPGNPRGLAVNSLFDLSHDPNEKMNLAEQNPSKATEMHTKLHEMLAHALSKKGVIPQLTIDRATEERLRSLGYTK
jgi:arylsulfatase A-like enzyme